MAIFRANFANKIDFAKNRGAPPGSAPVDISVVRKDSHPDRQTDRHTQLNTPSVNLAQCSVQSKIRFVTLFVICNRFICSTQLLFNVHVMSGLGLRKQEIRAAAKWAWEGLYLCNVACLRPTQNAGETMLYC